MTLPVDRLTEAARLGHVECVEKLVECEVDVDHTDHDGCSALQIAAAGQLDLARHCWRTGMRTFRTLVLPFCMTAVRGKAHVIGLVTGILREIA